MVTMMVTMVTVEYFHDELLGAWVAASRGRYKHWIQVSPLHDLVRSWNGFYADQAGMSGSSSSKRTWRWRFSLLRSQHQREGCVLQFVVGHVYTKNWGQLRCFGPPLQRSIVTAHLLLEGGYDRGMTRM
jgi:hypothetical protein